MSFGECCTHNSESSAGDLCRAVMVGQQRTDVFLDGDGDTDAKIHFSKRKQVVF